MFDHEKLQVYGKAVDLNLDVEGIPGRVRGNCWQGNVRRISAMVAGFETLSDKVCDKVRDGLGLRPQPRS